MQFKSLKKHESSFRQLRLFGISLLCAPATLLVGIRYGRHNVLPRRSGRRYMCLTRKSLMLALAQGSFARTARGGTGACEAFPRAVLLAGSRQERHRRATYQRALSLPTARHTAITCDLAEAGVLQTASYIGQYHTAHRDRQCEMRFPFLSLRC